ncbi:MAG: hypothetical protein BZ136_08205 [Methanosphaera sp. rholeuAM74]|nr:MAG: hypothetical protein BZ136_08205 [Methanosphaera sp. rholeuAM74]
MNKKMRELFTKIQAKTAEMRKALDDKELEKAKELGEELKKLNEEYELEKTLFTTEKKSNAPGTADLNGPAGEPGGEPGKGKDSTKAFAAAARNHFKAMSEGVNADGGYTVPQDIQTKIERLRDAKVSHRSLVRVKNTKTNKGQFPIKTRAQQTGFSLIGEGAAIGTTATPQFSIINYTIKKYGGILPVTNELLEDTDENITGIITEWLGDEARVTENKAILAAIGTQTAESISTLADIKRILNVTLGSAFIPTSSIITNDDGLNWLDTLEDADHRPLLNPDPTAPKQLRLSVGARTVPIVVIPNADMASTTSGSGQSATTQIPFIIGDLNEGIVLFDRKRITIAVSKEATVGALNLYEMDMTGFRGIERFDVQKRDAGAFVYAKLTV